MKRFFKGLGKAVLYTLFYLAVQIAVNIVAGIVYVVRLLVSGGIDPDNPDFIQQITDNLLQSSNLCAIISAVVAVGLLYLFFSVRKKRFADEISLSLHIRRGSVLPVALLGMAMAFLISLVLELLPIPEHVWEKYSELSSALTLGSPVVAFLATVIFAPIAEEVIFRGLVNTRLMRGMPTAAAIGIGSLIFGLMHGQIIWICYAAVLGVCMSLVALKYGNILASMVFHVVFNLFGSYITPYLEFENTAFTAAAAVLAAAAAAMLWRIVARDKTVRSVDGRPK